ncbi:DUF3693 domain-containing protein [Xanthomonas fragariae]|uniref:DUF3693 domain-containing protein n=1 Tax=Xanthomonas fragariae TaxID=48664 RepID=UPI003D2F7FA2
MRHEMSPIAVVSQSPASGSSPSRDGDGYPTQPGLPPGGAGGREIQRPFESRRDSMPLVVKCQGALKIMSTIDALLDAAMKAVHAKNDTELAKALGIKPAAVSNYRRGVSLPNAVVCATLAGLTGEPLAKVIGVVGEARAISSDEKAVWRRLAATAMTIAIGVSLALPGRAEASTDRNAGHTFKSDNAHALYIMRNQGSGRSSCRRQTR